MRFTFPRLAISAHTFVSMTVLVVLLALTAPSLCAQDSTWFRFVTQDAGFGNDTKALRFNAVDLNGDRYPDIAVVRGTYRRGDIRLYLNTPADAGTPLARRFVDHTAASGVNAHPWLDTTKKVECISFGDVDNDGDLDLVNAVWMYNTNIPFAEDQSEVLLNDGNAVFSHVADDGFETLADPSASSWALSVSGVSFLDYDLDGVLDAYVAAYWRTPNGPYHPDRLMRGNGDGTFTDVSQSARVTAAYPMQGASVTDWNNDGWPDVLTSPYCRSNGSLLRNEGDGSFRDIAPMVGYNARELQGDNSQNLCQWGAYPYDFDNDGDMDVLQVLVHGGLDAGEGRTVLSINQGPSQNYKLTQDLSRLHRSNPQSYHLGNMDAQWLDMNNDMLVDLVVSECEYLDNTDRPFFYLQGQDNHFYDITPQLELVGKIRSVHSLEALDYDRDGDYDLVMNSNYLAAQGNTNRGDIVFMENRIGNSNNWIGVQLVAPPDVNRAAIGARVVVYAGGVRQMREVQAGRGHFLRPGTSRAAVRSRAEHNGRQHRRALASAALRAQHADRRAGEPVHRRRRQRAGRARPACNRIPGAGPVSESRARHAAPADIGGTGCDRIPLESSRAAGVRGSRHRTVDRRLVAASGIVPPAPADGRRDDHAQGLRRALRGRPECPFPPPRACCATPAM